MTTDENAILQLVRDGILKIDSLGLIWKVQKKHKEWDGYRPCMPKLQGSENHGYIRVSIRDAEGNTFHAFAHRIVFIHNFRDIPEGLTINHKDGEGRNNRIDNLELMTPSQQMIHAVNVLGRKVGNHTHKARHWKIPREDVEAIKTSTLPSQELAATYGVTSQRIRQIRGGY